MSSVIGWREGQDFGHDHPCSSLSAFVQAFLARECAQVVDQYNGLEEVFGARVASACNEFQEAGFDLPVLESHGGRQGHVLV